MRNIETTEETGSREGRCIPLSYEELQNKFNGEGEIVHGWIWAYNLNRFIKHAWIKFPHNTEYIYEPVTDSLLSSKVWKERYKATEVKTYTYPEILKLSIITGSKGGEFEF